VFGLPRTAGAAGSNPHVSVVGLTTAWVFFYSLGALLLALPSEWHEGTVWRQLAPEDAR
jgi:hypothetical protein